MTARNRSIFAWAALVTVLNVFVTVALVRWGSPAAKADAGKAAPPPPATVTRAVTEADLNTITLTPEAEAHLAIRTAPVERRAVARVRAYGGETVIPAGRSVTVVAPVSGTLQAAGQADAPAAGAPATSPATATAATAPTPPATSPAAAPVPGQVVKKGTPLFTLAPMLTAEARTTLATSLVDAEGAVGAADVQVKGASIALERARRLLSENAGSQKAVDEAQAQHELAAQALEAARVRRDLLLRTVRDAGSDAVPPWVVEAPADGVLRAVHALPGQTVPAGAPLLEVAQLDELWVRVPVYVGDLNEIDTARPATVGPLADRATSATRPGEVSASTTRPATLARAAPPSADPAAATTDLIYQIDNRDGAHDPGQRVAVTLALKGEEESLVAPWAAVFRDIHGNAWVFEKIAPHAYVRRRVVVRHVIGDVAVLAFGPAPGTSLVTDGAAELAGREFGFAK